MNVQGLSVGHLSPTLMNSGIGRAAALPNGPPQGGASSQLTSITNDQGQSLLDIRDELRGAVKDAVQNAEGGSGFRDAIEGAIRSTLEEHGFDPEEVKGAVQDAGFGPMGAGAARRGNPMAALRGGGSGGFDPSALLQSGGTAEDLVQSFLEQFRAGTHLDFEV
ncbi:MAG: hypothetical protein AAGI22_24510 [Planctomycetota bacterium]